MSTNVFLLILGAVLVLSAALGFVRLYLYVLRHDDDIAWEEDWWDDDESEARG